MKQSLNTLRKRALQSTAFRGHVIKWIAPWHSESKSIQYGICVNCQMEVHINTNPLPNAIDIGGEAVALDCDVNPCATTT